MNLTESEKLLLTEAIQITAKEIDQFLPTASKKSRWRLEETKQRYETLTRKINRRE